MTLKDEIIKHKFIKINGVLYSVHKRLDGIIFLIKYNYEGKIINKT